MSAQTELTFTTDERVSLRRYLWHKHKGLCHWCHTQTHLKADQDDRQATIDHVIPRWKGGTNDEDNLVLACRLCNNRRNHEDQRQLQDGSLLGVFVSPPPKKSRHATRSRVCLSGDDKRAIIAVSRLRSAEEVLREQRDQSLAEIQRMQTKMASLEEIANMSLWQFTMHRLGVKKKEIE